MVTIAVLSVGEKCVQSFCWPLVRFKSYIDRIRNFAALEKDILRIVMPL
jgi:hypothetical protein